MKKTLVLLWVPLVLAISGPLFAVEEAPAPDSIYGRANAHYKKGTDFFLHKSWDAAEDEFSQATTLNPNYGRAFMMMGAAYAQQNKTPESIGAFRKALAVTLDTNMTAVIHYDLGIQYLKQGQQVLASDQFKQAGALNPKLGAPIPAYLQAAAPVSNRARRHTILIGRHLVDSKVIVIVLAVVITLLRYIYRVANRPTTPIAAAPNQTSSPALWSPEPELLAPSLPRRLLRTAGLGASIVTALVWLCSAALVIALCLLAGPQNVAQKGLSARAISFGILVLVPAAYFYLRYRKTQYLLQWGKAVGATVDKIEVGTKGSRTAHLTYDEGGRRQHVTCPLGSDQTLTCGRVMTAFVDGRYPRDAVLYATSGYRVIP